ncbi:MAG: DUF3667 domain-containing protein [Mariniphaga sp.]
MEEKSTIECKNCSSEFAGQFCSFCGQRYHEHKESFGELVYEFLSDFFHYDSRFFKTIIPLLFLPGKLTKSYNAGRQRSQFHPIRLCIFSSFVYFFLFFYFNRIGKAFENEVKNDPAIISADSTKQVISEDSLKLSIPQFSASSVKKKIQPEAAEVNPLSEKKNLITLKKNLITLEGTSIQDSTTYKSNIDSLLRNKITPSQYLAQQKMLGKERRSGYFIRILTVRLLEINLIGEEGKNEFLNKLIETFLHNIPKLLFFLLPVFALFLKLLYIRKKEFYYVDHAILSLHYFSFVFLLLIFSNYILNKIFNTGVFTSLAFLWMSVYLLIAMKRLYGQGWGKTIGKYIALGFLCSFALIIMITINMAWSVFMM